MSIIILVINSLGLFNNVKDNPGGFFLDEVYRVYSII